MKKNIIIGVVIGLVVVAVGLTLWKGTGTAPEGPAAENGTANQAPDTGQPQSKILTDTFSIDLLPGWVQIEPAEGATAMAVDAADEISDPAALEIGFRSYFAVTADTLGGKGISDYTATVKSELAGLIPGVAFINELDTTVGDRFAHFFELTMTQQDIPFRVLMAVVSGRSGDDVWVLSFNTTAGMWERYREAFYAVAQSFVVKR